MRTGWVLLGVMACGELPVRRNAGLARADVPAQEAGPAVCINEWVASNGQSLVLADGATPDWVELFVAGEGSVPLDGWRLEDGDTSLSLDGRVVPGGGHLLVPLDGALALSVDGDELRLRAPSGRIADHVRWGRLVRDAAVARIPDGSDTLVVVAGGTPGAENRAP